MPLQIFDCVHLSECIGFAGDMSDFFAAQSKARLE
jgi:hypothetical protein